MKFPLEATAMAALSLVLAGCAPPVANNDAGIEAALARADASAAASPASTAAASRFSRAAATGAAAPLASSTLQLSELLETPASLQPDEGERVVFDAEAAPVGFSAAIAAALQNDVDVAIAAEKVNEAEAARINAIFGYLPRVSGSATYSQIYQNVIDTDNAVFQAGEASFNAFSVTGEARQPLLNFSEMLAIDSAEVGKTAAEAAYVAATQASAFSAATVYLQALEAQTKIDGAEARLALLDEQIAAENRLVAAGLSTPTGKQLIDVEKGAINIELLEYREELSLALAELGRLIGQPVRRVAPVEAPAAIIADAGTLPWEDYANAAFRANAELKELRLRTLQQRQSFYSQFLEDFAPTVDLFARLEYEDREASRFGGGSETRDFTVGVEANLPIFNASGDGYLSTEAESRMRQSVLAEAEQRRALEAEVRALVDRLAAQRRNISDADIALNSATQLVASARRGADLGVSSDILEMRQNIQRIQAETWASRSRYSLLRSWVRLAFLTGESVDL